MACPQANHQRITALRATEQFRITRARIQRERACASAMAIDAREAVRLLTVRARSSRWLCTATHVLPLALVLNPLTMLAPTLQAPDQLGQATLERAYASLVTWLAAESSAAQLVELVS